MLFKHKITYKGIEFDSRDEPLHVICATCRTRAPSRLRRQYSLELIPRQSKMVVKHLKTKDKMVEKFLENPAIYTCDFAHGERGVCCGRR